MIQILLLCYCLCRRFVNYSAIQHVNYSVCKGLKPCIVGYDYNGFAWYRLSFTMANQPGKKTMLHFGAVDEEAVVYLDGKLAGTHNEGKNGWDKPFALDLTPRLTEEAKPHQIAIQVFDSMAAGGIWKPVYIRYE